MINLVDSKEYRNEFDFNLSSIILKFNLKIEIGIILIADNPSSLIYVQKKIESMKKVGIVPKLIRLSSDTSETDLIKTVQNLNSDKSITGLIVQFPLPSHINSFNVILNIDPKKDLDGLHPYNAGLLNTIKKQDIYTMDLESLTKILNEKDLGVKAPIIPCTPLGIIQIIHRQGFNLSGKNALVFGNSNLVGKPISRLLTLYEATVTTIHSKTKNIKNLIQNTDLIISAVGIKNLITEELIENSNVQLIIDVGINFDKNGKICGDVDKMLYKSENLQNLTITKVPGGVGPMTIAALMFNATLIEFAKKINK